MKSTLSGLVAAIIVGAIGLILLRSTGIIKLPGLSPSPTPTSSASPNFELSPEASPVTSPTSSSTPAPSSSPTTKGGQVQGESVSTSSQSSSSVSVVTKSTTTTTETISHTTITLAKVSKCPSQVTSELKDISSSLSLQYDIKDNYSAAITVWGDNGVELVGQKLYTGQGKILDTGHNKYLKVLIQPSSCPAAEDNWMSVTASR